MYKGAQRGTKGHKGHLKTQKKYDIVIIRSKKIISFPSKNISKLDLF